MSISYNPIIPKKSVHYLAELSIRLFPVLGLQVSQHAVTASPSIYLKSQVAPFVPDLSRIGLHGCRPTTSWADSIRRMLEAMH